MVPEELLYTKEHEWVRLEGEFAVVGITDYAQNQLGDIVYVELPEVGTKVEHMKPFGTIEAVKAVSDLYSPLSGEVVEVNEKVMAEPSIIKTSPYGDGWMVKIKISNEDEVKSLLKPEDYRRQIGE